MSGARRLHIKITESTLKIDRSFVQTVAGDPSVFSIVKAICSMAGNPGMKVVAEGAETAAQAVALRALGCQMLRGYFFGKPIPAEKFAAGIK